MPSLKKETLRKVAPSGQSPPGIRDLECVPAHTYEYTFHALTETKTGDVHVLSSIVQLQCSVVLV
jgi:hypothetical protein